jgi:hypothetical protein
MISSIVAYFMFCWLFGYKDRSAYDVAVEERQDGPEHQRDDCFVRWTIALIEVLSNE